MKQEIAKTDAEWRERLSPEQYRVLREKGTEAAFAGRFDESKAVGTYTCAGCGTERKAVAPTAESQSGVSYA